MALVSVTICTSERRIYRFDSLEAAAEFRCRAARESVYPGKPIGESFSPHTSRVLAWMREQERDTSAPEIEDVLDLNLSTVNRILRRLTADACIVCIGMDPKRGNRKLYRVTLKGQIAQYPTHLEQA